MGRPRTAGLTLVFLAGIATACCSTAPTRPSATPDGSSVQPAGTSACASTIEGAERLANSTVLLGEMHGTTETPALFADLVRHAASRHQGQTVLVGLELPTSMQPAIDLLLDGPEQGAGTQALLDHSFWHRDTQDGRSSQAMLALLVRLRTYRAEGMRLAVRAIDSDTGADKDAFMARTLSEASATIRPAQTMVLVGDYHSRVIKGYMWKPDDDHRPMGMLLREKDPDVLGLRVIGRSAGSAWMCNMRLECGPGPLRAHDFEGSVPQLALDLDAADKVGWCGTLFVEALNASPPAIGTLPAGS
jgi:hypothetical protein